MHKFESYWKQRLQSRIVSLVFDRKQLKFRECERSQMRNNIQTFIFPLLDNDSFILYQHTCDGNLNSARVVNILAFLALDYPVENFKNKGVVNNSS